MLPGGISPPDVADYIHSVRDCLPPDVRFQDVAKLLARADMLNHLEAFGDQFERIARTPEQRQLAASFQKWIAHTSHHLLLPLAREAVHKANAPAAASHSAALSATLFGGDADARNKRPDLHNDSPPHDRGGRRR